MTGKDALNEWLRNRSLLTKVLWGMLVFTCISYWVADSFTSLEVSRAFNLQLDEILEEAAFQQRNHFTRAVDSYPQTVALLANRQSLIAHMEVHESASARQKSGGRHDAGPRPPTGHMVAPELVEENDFDVHDNAPSWMNNILFSRAFVSPSYIFLFDRDGQPTDVYKPSSGVVHKDIIHINKITLDMSINQSVIRMANDVPHLLAAQEVRSSAGKLLGYILCATHIDEDFLVIVNGPPSHWNLMVLTDTDNGKIIASNNSVDLSVGTSLDDLSKSYRFSQPKILALAGMEMNFALASIVNEESVEQLYGSIIAKQRLTHLLQAFFYIGPVMLIVIWLTSRISRLTLLVEEFSRNNLTVNDDETPFKGDQINSLEECFHRLTKAMAKRTSQLESTNRELEAFSYSVSHDLRAPLRGIDGFSLALSEDYGRCLDQQGQDYLARIRRGARHMGELIDGMLLLSKISRSELKFERIDLSKMVSTSLEELGRANPERDAYFTVAQGVTAYGDSRILGLAIRNLLDNAWKFTSRNVQTRIEFGPAHTPPPAMEVLPDQKVYYIKDNGAGFDGAHASKLFTAFQRLHSTDEFPGNGVGLAIVQRVINRHGGRIWAEGQVDQGATFFFSLGGPP